MSCLGGDVLSHIFSHLRPYDIITSASAVCREWSATTNERGLWQLQISTAIRVAQIRLPFISPERVTQALADEVAGRITMSAKGKSGRPGGVIIIWVDWCPDTQPSLLQRISLLRFCASPRCWPEWLAQTMSSAKSSPRPPTLTLGPTKKWSAQATRAWRTAWRTGASLASIDAASMQPPSWTATLAAGKT